MLLKNLIFATAALSAQAFAAKILYATSYDGTVNTLTLNEGSFTNTSTIKSCGTNPSWLTYKKGELYCSNEGTPGSLFMYTTTPEGVLTEKVSINSTGGDVHSGFFGKSSIATVHYGVGGITAYALPLVADAKPVQNLSFPFTPGPNPDRQTKDTPHQVIGDPTGKILVSPNLGSDLVRVFAIQQDSTLKQLDDLKVEAGAGPRHAAFYKVDEDVSYMYLTQELSSTLMGYKVTGISKATPKFEKIFGPSSTIPAAANHTEQFIAGVQVHGKTVTVSNRGDSSFGADVDSLTVFAIGEKGVLELKGFYTSAGKFPRSFDISMGGKYLAVGNQKSNETVVFAREPETGVLGVVLGRVKLGGEVSSVKWGCDM